MIVLIRSPRIRQLEIFSPSIFHFLPRPFPPALVQSYHAGRAGSVNTAIRRGLRKSKGTAFRGPKNPRTDDPRVIYQARSGLRPDEFANTHSDSASRKHEARTVAQNVRPARGKLWALRGRTSLKDHSKLSSGGSKRGEAILRAEGHQDSEMYGRFGEKLTPRIRKVEPTRSRFSRGEAYSEPSHNQSASTSNFGTDSGAHKSSRRSNLVYDLGPQGSGSRDAWPSLSFHEKSAGSRIPKVFESRFSSQDDPFPADANKSSKFGTRSRGRPIPRVADRTVQPRKNQPMHGSFDTFKSRSPGGGRQSMERQLTRGPPEGRARTSQRGDSEAKQSLGKHADSHSSSTAHVSHVFDKHMPLSIPYTTPASEFLYGTSVVEAAIASSRSPKRKLYKFYIYTGENREDVDRDSRLERLAQSNGIQVVRVGTEWVRLMDKMSNGRPHNGYILEASPLPKLPVTRLGEFRSDYNQEGFKVSIDHQSREEAAVNGTIDFIRTKICPSGRKPLVLLLDSIVDPGNLGGIIRTASFLGVSAIAISTRNSAPFTPVVLKASAGASENITLLSVNKPAGFIVDSKAAGWRVYAAVAPGKRNDPSLPAALSTDDLADPLTEAPCILMLGSEGEGLRWNLRSKANFDLYIQGSSQSFSVDSLNVSVAAGILCSAFLSKGRAGARVSDNLAAEASVGDRSAAAGGALF